MPSDRWVWTWDAVAAVATAFAAIVALAVAVVAYLEAHRDRRVRQREADRRWKVGLLGELLASYDGVSYAEVTGRQLRLLAMLGDVELPRWPAWVEVVGLEDRHDLSDMEGLDWFMATFAGCGSSGDYVLNGIGHADDPALWMQMSIVRPLPMLCRRRGGGQHGAPAA